MHMGKPFSKPFTRKVSHESSTSGQKKKKNYIYMGPRRTALKLKSGFIHIQPKQGGCKREYEMCIVAQAGFLTRRNGGRWINGWISRKKNRGKRTESATENL